MVFRGYEWGSVFANRVQGEDFTGWTAIINENTVVCSSNLRMRKCFRPFPCTVYSLITVI